MTDFLVCLLFGWLGVHKFREKKTGSGILYLFTFGLFGFGWIFDCVKYLKPLLKKKAAADIANGAPLPVVAHSNVMLTPGEVCHYLASATFVKTKNVVVGHSGGHSGVSIRVAKGMSYRVGNSQSTAIRGNVQEKTSGLLSITNKRIVFSASKGAFDKRISELSAITPYKDGIGFQFGSAQYPLITPDAEYIYQIISRIINDKTDGVE
jgi:hypothetical protein